MLKVGLLGSNDLIDQYISVIAQNSDLELIGFYTTNSFATEFEDLRLSNYSTVLENASTILILPSDQQYYFAQKSLLTGKHIYIHNIFSFTEFQLNNLASIANEGKSLCYLPQNGFVMNEDMLDIKKSIPYYLQIEHNASLESKHKDKLVQDLLIYDLDLLFFIHQRTIKKSNAYAFSVHDQFVDLINVHIHFDNGSVANILCSSLDEKAQRHKISYFAQRQNGEYNLQLKLELELKNIIDGLANTIINKKSVSYQIYDALNTLSIAQKITNKLIYSTIKIV